MIFVLEGVDGSGKTTLAKQLVTQLTERYGSCVYHHEGPPPLDVDILEHYGTLLECLRTEPAVIDRFALGERVYGPVLRGVDRLGPEGWRLMRRLYAAAGVRHVLCLPLYDVCHANWSSGRPEHFAAEGAFRQTYERFKNLAGEVDWIYDYTVGEVRWDLSQTMQLPRTMVGNQTAPYLFVGDKGSNPQAGHNLPFFSTVGSSRYLNEALRDAGYDEDELSLVNAYNLDGTPATGPWRVPEKVVALGERAAAACNARHIKHVVVPHPQYWKRFHAHDRNNYVGILRSCRC